MKERTDGEFQIAPTQFAAFSFTVPPRSTMVNIQLIATAPVNLLFERNKAEYEEGKSHSDPQWLRVKDLDRVLEIDPGTWYLIVEGVEEPSRGLVKVRLAREDSLLLRLVDR